MNSGILKTEALCFMRYVKKMDYVCTEGGYWNADVLGSNETSIIEIEVKISKADLEREFKDKLAKHEYYKSGLATWSPNYFYFMVPEALGQIAVEIAKEKAPKAGVLVYIPNPRIPSGRRTTCLRNPTKLHQKKPSEKLKRAILKRMGSEVCGLHQAMNKLRATEIAQVDELRKEIIDAIIAAQGTEEWEQPNEASNIEPAEVL